MAVTAFLPLIAFAPLGIATMEDAAAPFAHPIVFLFLGGFLVAGAVERSGLHRRMALAVLDWVGTDGRRLVGGFMLASALLSMWMTNTSTTMMLLPIVLSVSTVVRENSEAAPEGAVDDFAVALLLGIAYAASIGGLATLIGTPPNAFLSGYLSKTYGEEIGFASWMMIGVPVAALLLPVAWWLLTFVVFPVRIGASPAVEEHLHELREKLGDMSTAERRVAALFLGLILSWLLRRPAMDVFGLVGVTDAGIAMTAGLLLFLIPDGRDEADFLLRWEDALRVPWGVLLLFGGGMSLAAAVSETGLALWLGERLAPLGASGPVVVVLGAVLLVVFLTELTSNLATTATLLPVLGAIAVETGMPPLLLAVPVTIASSCAFMLPVATPPNAIIFATGEVRISQMVRAGFWLNLIGVVIVAAACLTIAPLLLGD